MADDHEANNASVTLTLPLFQSLPRNLNVILLTDLSFKRRLFSRLDGCNDSSRGGASLSGSASSNVHTRCPIDGTNRGDPET